MTAEYSNKVFNYQSVFDLYHDNGKSVIATPDITLENKLLFKGY
jgi:hypothetical protein